MPRQEMNCVLVDNSATFARVTQIRQTSADTDSLKKLEIKTKLTAMKNLNKVSIKNQQKADQL